MIKNSNQMNFMRQKKASFEVMKLKCSVKLK